MLNENRKLRGVLGVLLVIMTGIWLYVGPFSPEPQLKSDQLPHAISNTPRRFVLWELHADDTVRVVEIVTEDQALDAEMSLYSPNISSTDDILTFTSLGGQLTTQPTLQQEVYRNKTYLRYLYKMYVAADRYGYALQMAHPPHLHINGKWRIISLGIDPKPYYAQEIIAVAVPAAAHIKNIYDYQPYRHITLDDWDVYYYDTSHIQQHISIHIRYRPAADVPALNWKTVEAQR
ncbi:MAG: hypothetical protein JXA33_28040 [Anaerolineae bacterium]|nr:hypothetical protein [Anaerolineae bacterium]